MKKSYILLLAAASILSSCKMDVFPEGTITDTEALNEVKDYTRFSNGLYTQMRYITSGDMVILSDIQLDDFHAVIGNGNRRMDFYNGTFTPNTREIESIYARYYAVIAETNFLINHADQRLMGETLEPIDKALLHRSLGESLMFRAYCYNELANKFCGSYKNSKDITSEGKGLSLQLTYNPTTDNSKFVGRSSLKTTYKQIISDLNQAEEHITAFEATAKDKSLGARLRSKLADINQDTTMLQPVANDVYVSSDAVKAMKARVYLNMGENELAFKYAKEVIETNRYPLTTTNDFVRLWRDDLGSEVIWRVDAELKFHGNSSGSAFRNNVTNPDYVPTNECSFLYASNDIRLLSWMINTPINNAGGTENLQSFNKYPGNPKLYAEGASSNFTNIAKPFRSAELYLICAEALYKVDTRLESQNNSESKFYLSKLVESRKSYNGYDENDNWININEALYNKENGEYLTELRKERHRELIGEGFRLSDLKRWNLGFKRGTPLFGRGSVLISNNQSLEYESDDHRLVWPIPQHEINANPQISAQQNPGY